MINPWRKIPLHTPYVLKEDHNEIIKFNSNKKLILEHKIFLDDVPVPYIGNCKNPKVILLQLNPGLEIPPGLDFPNLEIDYSDKIKFDLLANLKKDTNVFLSLEHKLTGAFRYWSKVFGEILKSKECYKKVADTILCIEYFPYHSKNYKELPARLKSQEYAFNLVKKYIKKGLPIILMRGKKQWFNAVKELKNYNKLYYTKSNRNVRLSKKNLPGFYLELEKIIQINQN